MKKIILLIFGISMFAYSCDTIDFGDTNENVNGPAEANTASLISGAMTNFSTREGRPYRITPALYVQYFMQHVYNSEMLYAEGPGYWRSYYVQTASNCQQVIDICNDPASADITSVTANGAIENQLAVAMIFKSVIFKRITDAFGDVPYSEFYNPEIISPKYDKQKDIYTGMINDVKAARDMIRTDLPGAEGDAVYGGDMGKWQKFANSFLMTLSMQLSKVDEAYARSVFTEALGHSAGVIETMSDEAWYTYDMMNGFNNPWNWMRPADYGVSKEFASSLRGDANSITSNTTNDDRLAFFAADPTLEGMPYGYSTDSGTDCPVNATLIAPETHLPLLTAAYTYLNRAEAASLGWTTEDVATMLTNGILASYATGNAIYGGAFDGTAYAAARVADMATNSELQVIGEEKWVALCPQGFDAWDEWRRTGWPVLAPAHDAMNDGNIPTRYNYPSEEPNINSSNYNTGVSGLTPADDKNTAKVWWDVD